MIDVDGHRARSRLSIFESSRRTGSDDLSVIFGTYEDEYVLLDAGWRFHRRRFTLRLRALMPAAKIQQISGFAPEFTFLA